MTIRPMPCTIRIHYWRRLVVLMSVLTAAGSVETAALAQGTLYWSSAEEVAPEVYAGRITRAALDGTGAATLFESSTANDLRPQILALDADGQRLYFTFEKEGTLELDGIARINLDGSGLDDLVLDFDINGLAVDAVHDMLYWSTTEEVASGSYTGRIVRANLDGTAPAAIFKSTDDLRPEALALDAANEVLYFTFEREESVDYSSGVARINLDGTGLQILASRHIDDGAFYGVAVDTAAGRIYWSAVEKSGSMLNEARTARIIRANLDGTDPEVIVESTGDLTPQSLVLHPAAQTLYFTFEKEAVEDYIQGIGGIGLDGTGLDELVVAEVVGLAVAAGPPPPPAEPPADSTRIDSLALVDLYQATDGAQWTTRTNWLQGPLDTWEGVTVSAVPVGNTTVARVTGLHLANANLAGTLPETLKNLNRLQELDLSENELSGPLPDGVGTWADLEEIDLEGNALSGPLPPTVAAWDKLRELDLSANGFEGTIPAGLFGRASLTFFDVHGNAFSGTLPDTIGTLTNVEVLDLSANAFAGPLPPALGRLQALQELILNDNAFSGPLPVELAGLDELFLLYVQNTDLCVPDDSDFQNWLAALDDVQGAEQVCSGVGGTPVEPAEAPASFALHAAYPNPFNPTTTIAFDLPAAGVASLVVYDVLGRQVEVLVAGRLAAGAHAVTWAAEGLSSGVYVCRLRAGDQVQTRTLTLIQ